MADTDYVEEAQPSLEFLRLRWQITDGPAFSHINVIEDPEDAASAQCPLQAADGTFHEIAAAPCSDPPTARLTLQLEEATYLGVEGDASEPLSTPAARLDIAAAAGETHVSIRAYVEQTHAWFLAQRQRHFEGYGYGGEGGEALPADTQLWFDPSSPNVINFFDSVEAEPPFAFEWSLVADMASGILHGHSEEEYVDEYDGPIDPIEDL
ncbi:hypothetical protein CCM_00498 [Cordyceps militaris CM01]|uniref:Uncharacterized protein n=1 Tax=Cordyceps militaris (strain CM01) TaxID=983644 RepID=G3J4H4_CORMM|nr:uncharacterized protein CCM_00498 [Cordyceps militaris CM01]EGX95844.1 hypothetical protein CCM_00498 [Cordyceps militaris CM01]